MKDDDLDLPSFRTAADLLVYIEGIMAGKLGESARLIRESVAAGEIAADDAEALIDFALEEIQREISMNVRPQIESLLRRHREKRKS